MRCRLRPSARAASVCDFTAPLARRSLSLSSVAFGGRFFRADTIVRVHCTTNGSVSRNTSSRFLPTLERSRPTPQPPSAARPLGPAPRPARRSRPRQPARAWRPSSPAAVERAARGGGGRAVAHRDARRRWLGPPGCPPEASAPEMNLASCFVPETLRDSSCRAPEVRSILPAALAVE